MASPAELSLDFKPSTYAMIQKPVAEQKQQEQNQKIQDFLARLEEERHKIEAFKRELPLCMQLLNNAIECYKQQLESTFQATTQGPRPVLEEFIPLKHVSSDASDDKAHNAPSEKANWMISAQLWNPHSIDTSAQLQTAPLPQSPLPREVEQVSIDMSPKLALDGKLRNGGAFLPFSKDKIRGCARASPRALPELALASSEKISENNKCAEVEKRDINGSSGGGTEQGKGGCGSNASDGQSAALPTHRKARRCWSPDLHRRFVNALQILGGSQVATPKQIRELMKVDGLTNDEVKSHLQKYRLHTRRPAAAPQAATAAAAQLVVLGGIWVPPEYATSAGAPAIYSAHAGPAHYCAAAPMPQEFYPPVAAQHHHHMRPPVHRGVAEFKPRTVRLPESEARSGGELSESLEEEEEEEGEEEEREEVEEVEEEEEEEEKENLKALEKAVVRVAVKADDEF